MADTKIEWAEKSWNPITGCTRCSPGCENCYAERMAYRLACMGQKKYQKVISTDGGVWNHKIYCDEKSLDIPLHWRKPCRIFVCSMSDLFHKKVPFEFIDNVFGAMFAAPQHIYQILTKRPKRMAEYIPHLDDNCFECGDPICWSAKPNSNIHLGVSISNQAEADEKIPILLRIPAAVRWLSIEPMLGRIKLNHIKTNERTLNALKGVSKYKVDGNTPYYGHFIDWVVVGGESGPGARPIHPDWVRNIRDQCVAAGVPFYFKQWGEWLIGNDPIVQSMNTLNFWPKRVTSIGDDNFFRVTKKKAGRLLDGREWKQLPGERL